MSTYRVAAPAQAMGPSTAGLAAAPKPGTTIDEAP